MKYSKLIAVVGVIGMLAAVSQAGAIFQIDFNSDTTGAAPAVAPAVVGGTSTHPTAVTAAYATVSDDFTDPNTGNSWGAGSMVVELTPSPGAAHSLLTCDFDANDTYSSGRVKIEFDLMYSWPDPNSSPDRREDFSVTVYNDLAGTDPDGDGTLYPVNAILGRLSFQGDTADMGVKGVVGLDARDNNGLKTLDDGVAHHNYTSIDYGVLHTWTMVIDMDSDHIIVFKDHVKVGQRVMGSYQDVSKTIFQVARGNASPSLVPTGVIDNIYIPEPATMTLLGLGAAGLLIRRKRS